MATMRDAGVTGPPHIVDVTPVEDLTRKDCRWRASSSATRGATTRAWKMAFDARRPRRGREAGVIGHAVTAACGPERGRRHLQAESLDALRAFAASPELKQVMQAAGVVVTPDRLRQR